MLAVGGVICVVDSVQSVQPGRRRKTRRVWLPPWPPPSGIVSTSRQPDFNISVKKKKRLG